MYLYSPTHFLKILAQAEKLVNECNFDQAIKVLDENIQKSELNFKQNFPFLNFKGKILIWQSNFEKAIELGELIFIEMILFIINEL